MNFVAGLDHLDKVFDWLGNLRDALGALCANNVQYLFETKIDFEVLTTDGLQRVSQLMTDSGIRDG